MVSFKVTWVAISERMGIDGRQAHKVLRIWGLEHERFQHGGRIFLLKVRCEGSFHVAKFWGS